MNSMAMPCSACSSRSSSSTCAWMVTSSAVVGSSAISSSGSPASAAAIIARCFMPPDSWCGYSSMRCRGRGMRTASSSSSARVRAARRPRPRWRRRASWICWPTVITGLSEVIGSWKIRPTVPPRTARMRASGRSSSSWPARRTEPASMVAASGSRRISASAVTDLPLPDSPSSAKVPRRGMRKPTPSTAVSRAAPAPKDTRRPATSSSGLTGAPAGRRRRAPRPPAGWRTAPART